MVGCTSIFGYSYMIPPQGVDRREGTTENVGSKVKIKVQLPILTDLEILIQGFM